jgi:hypothetical protein
MKRSQTAVLFAVAVLFFAVGMSVSRPISAAERPAAKPTVLRKNSVRIRFCEFFA